MSRSTPLPPDLQQLADGLAAVERDLGELIRDLSDEAFNWQPEAGRAWSIAQVLDHLIVAGRLYLDRMEPAIAEASPERQPRRGPIAPGAFSRWFIRSLEPSSTRRLPAPKKIVPASTGRKAELWPEFQRMHARAVELMARAAGLELNRIRFTNPFLPVWRVTLGTGFRILETHERRHLGQAQRVCATAGFPG